MAHACALALSVPLAILLVEPGRIAKFFVKIYVGIFRGVPTLLQLLFVWNVLPQLFPVFREAWFSPFLAAWVALTLNEVAYQIEINRAALQAIPSGQKEAGYASGLTRFQTYRLIIVPQTVRVALPPTMNEFITLLKTTSLASVISFRELMTVSSQSAAVSFKFLEYYSVAVVYYLVIVTALTTIQGILERRMTWAIIR